MNKKEYLTRLQYYLTPLQAEERRELLKDYEAHFTFGVQSGKTEEQIARELGDPLAIARETIGVDNVPLPPQPPARPDTARTIGVTIVLFFFNLFAIPLVACLWGLLLMIGVFAASCLLSFAVLFAENQIYGGYETYKLYSAFMMTGIGILLAASIPTLWKGWRSGTIRYFNWTVWIWKGRD